MPVPAEVGMSICNCAALRHAARHVTQLYDRHLTPAGLRTTQFSILARINALGPITVGALAETMGMDRTTLTRNIRPLEREGLVAVREGESDRRSKLLSLTEAGKGRYCVAMTAWKHAQSEFEREFGRERSAKLREELQAVTLAGRSSSGDPG
jgi:DNA-binding MarR family transcriptional regulator